MLKNLSWSSMQTICLGYTRDLDPTHIPASTPNFLPSHSTLKSALASFSYFGTMLFAPGPLPKLSPLLETGTANLSGSSTCCQLLFIFQVSI